MLIELGKSGRTGKYMLHSDKHSLWITEVKPYTLGESKRRKKKDEIQEEKNIFKSSDGNMTYIETNISGYYNDLSDVLLSFARQKIRMSDAGTVEELIAAMEQIKKDIKSFTKKCNLTVKELKQLEALKSGGD